MRITNDSKLVMVCAFFFSLGALIALWFPFWVVPVIVGVMIAWSFLKDW